MCVGVVASVRFWLRACTEASAPNAFKALIRMQGALILCALEVIRYGF